MKIYSTMQSFAQVYHWECSYTGIDSWENQKRQLGTREKLTMKNLIDKRMHILQILLCKEEPCAGSICDQT